MKRKQKVQCLYDTDTLALNVHSSLVRDFRSMLGKNFWNIPEKELQKSVSLFRDIDNPKQLTIDPHLFKCVHQMENLLKKYRFKDDKFTDDELHDRTLQKYCSFQQQLAVPRKRVESTFRVLQRARRIAHRILGEYSESDIFSHLKFGKNSSIGCPLAFAYIDYKLSNVKAFTGSSEMSRWFLNNIIHSDKNMALIYERLVSSLETGCSLPLDIESLTLIEVPKSWKILRSITPLALLNLFYSHGLGGLVTKKLKECGLDIGRLQHRHRLLVQKFSRTRTHATADLSAASDSITKELCNMVLPRPWYVALKKVMTHQLTYKDNDVEKQMYTLSVLPMGNGATFPFETLIFYCVTKAICELSGVDGLVSVYGDDLIYPSRAHRYVRHIFPKIGFTLNLEKTYVSSAFRESCGADYYRGFDVRPFFLTGSHRRLTRSKYIVELYKLYNGLRRRWSDFEIRQTLYYLLSEMSRTGYRIMRVPPSYPATAGIHTSRPDIYPLGMTFLDYSPIFAVFKYGSAWFRFKYMSEKAPKRFVSYQEPYYFLKLLGDNDVAFDWNSGINHNRTHGLIGPEPVLRWTKVRRYRSYRAGNVMKRKSRERLKPYVAEKRCTTIQESTGSVSDWI